MSQDNPIHVFKLDESGLGHIFGELEAKLVKAIWELGQANVQEVIDYLGGNLNYKTVMTVLNRLADKGVLKRRKRSRAFIYTAAASREDLLAGVFDQLVRGMFNDEFRGIALSQMIETAEALDPEILDEISRLIQKRKTDATTV